MKINSHLKECLLGLLWATIVLVIIFVHYTMCIDVPDFRYVGY